MSGTLEAKLKTLAFDIETYEEGSETRIVMISLYGSLKKVLTYKKGSYPSYVEVLKNEKEMLERFVQIIKNFHANIFPSVPSFRLYQVWSQFRPIQTNCSLGFVAG